MAALERGATGSVLVVDDEEGVRQALRCLLEPKWRVLSAENGERAIEIVRSEDPDVVTLDLTMPGLSGVETLTRIRDLSPDVEVVVVTGFGSFETAVEALRLRAFDYVTKPFDARRILDIVECAERSHRNRLDAVASNDPPVVAGEISERLSALERSDGWNGSETDRVQLDYARLLANAVRDRIDSDPGGRIEVLLDALGEIRATARPSALQNQVALDGVRTLARGLRTQPVRRSRLS